MHQRAAGRLHHHHLSYSNHNLHHAKSKVSSLHPLVSSRLGARDLSDGRSGSFINFKGTTLQLRYLGARLHHQLVLCDLERSSFGPSSPPLR